jgi:hypothetical protein
MTAAEQAEQYIALLTEQVMRQLEALTFCLRATLRRAQYGEKCIVVVNGDRFY